MGVRIVSWGQELKVGSADIISPGVYWLLLDGSR